MCCSSRVPAFLSLFHAPDLQILEIRPLAQLPMQTLMKQITRCTSLQILSVTTARLPEESAPSPEGDYAGDSDAAASPNDARAPLQLPCLERLAVFSSCAVTRMNNAATIAQLAPDSLEFLELAEDSTIGDSPQVPVSGRNDLSGVDPEALMRASCRAFAAVGRFTCLDDLTLECLCVPPGATPAAYTASLACVLHRVPQLTYLRLQPIQGCDLTLDSASLSGAISSLTDLERLTLDGYITRFAVTPMQLLIEAIAQLQNITQLDLVMADITPERVAYLLQRLPLLKELNTWEHVFEGTEQERLKSLRTQFSSVTIGLNSPCVE